MQKLKKGLLPLILASLVIIGGISVHFSSSNWRGPTEDEVITNLMVNTFMVSTESRNPEDQLAQKLGLVGHGTGFIYTIEDDGDAVVITNYHVVEKHVKRPDITHLKLYMINRPWPYDAEVIGVDEVTDIALLRISPHDNETWESFEWETDKSILEGLEIISLGHGLSQPFTLTKGIISGTDRWTVKPLNFMLQHTAIINVGNSGGPIVNKEGKVVGVNSMILSPSSNRSGVAAWDGVAFAIPSWQADFSAREILDKGYVKYARVDFGTRTPTIEEVHEQDECHDGDRKERSYAYLELTENSKHARMMGLKQNDIVYSVEGYRVYGIAGIIKGFIDYRPKDVILMKVLRDCEFIEIDYQLLAIDMKTRMPFNTGR